MRQLLLVTVLVCIAGHAAHAQSLADVARREEERRKSVTASTRVYTNEDLASSPQPAPVPVTAASPSPAGAAPANGEAAKADAATDEAGKPAAAAASARVNENRDEKHWRERARDYRTRLSKMRSDVEAVEGRLETLRAAPQTPGVAAEVRLAERDLAGFQSKLQALAQEWARIENMARTLGASAWIQE